VILVVDTNVLVSALLNPGRTPDTRLVQFDATWPDAVNSVRGSFEYSLR
jgi:predicted nucleic acid-binding protein